MADITLPQTIPSALRDEYKKVLGVARDGNRVFKRYPFRVPSMQTKDGNPSPEQKKQRLRFIEATKSFASTDDDTRERWFDAMPEYHSLLWYYNYFIMSSLNGNADISDGGAGVIKSIQFKTIAMPAGSGEGSVAITAIDPTKAVVMLFGQSVSKQEEEAYYIVVPVAPYISSLAAELVKCKWSLPQPTDNNTIAASIGITVIEYI